MIFDKQTQKLFTKLAKLEKYYEIHFNADVDYFEIWFNSKRKTAESFNMDFLTPVTDSILATLESVLEEHEKSSPEDEIEWRRR